MESAVFSDVTPRSPVDILEKHIPSIFSIKSFLNLKVGGTYRYRCALKG
jgi:hypothetical protein